MTKKILILCSIAAVGFIIGAILGNFWGYSNVQVAVRKAYLNKALDSLDLQIPTLLKMRSNSDITAHALKPMENLVFANIILIKGIRPNISKFNFNQISVLCQTETYFKKYGFYKDLNNRPEALAIGYLQEIMPSVRSRANKIANKVGMTGGHESREFKKAFKKEYGYPLPEKGTVPVCLWINRVRLD